MDHKDVYEKLRAQEERNRELTAEINHLDEILDEKRIDEEVSKRELEQLRHQNQAIRNTLPWRTLKNVRKSLRNVKKYGIGRRHIRQMRSANKMKQAKKQVDRLRNQV